MAERSDRALLCYCCWSSMPFSSLSWQGTWRGPSLCEVALCATWQLAIRGASGEVHCYKKGAWRLVIQISEVARVTAVRGEGNRAAHLYRGYLSGEMPFLTDIPGRFRNFGRVYLHAQGCRSTSLIGQCFLRSQITPMQTCRTIQEK